ncbi:MAG: TlpA family protein disulfide reductase [Candidatus Wallbacteria bacterium]|nr:TlpA family protein disulfide reductase [Candidatus Wallbacteria bacterium]
MIQPGLQAPAIRLPTPEGRVVSVPDAVSLGPVVLAFFKVSCPTCQLTFPYLQKLHAAYGDAGVTVLGISQDGPEETVRFAAERGCTFRMLLDGEGYPASRAFGLETVPAIFLVGKDGQVWETLAGWSRQEMNSLSGTLARMSGVEVAVVSREDDAAPAWKPG